MNIKNKIGNIVVYLGCSLLFFGSGCKPENIDFTHLKDVDWETDTGLPLGTVRYSVNDLLQQLDKNGYIEQEAGGDLRYTFSMEKENVVDVDSLMSFNPSDGEFGPFEIQNISPVPVPLEMNFDYPITLNSSEIVLSEGVFKSGTIDVVIQFNVASTHSISVVFPNVRKPNGEVYEIALNGTNTDHHLYTADLAGCSLTPDNEENTFQCNGKVVFTSDPGVPEYSLSGTYHVNTVSLKHLEGKINPRTYAVSENIDFEMLSYLSNSNYGAMVTIYDPIVSLGVKNSFNLQGQFSIENIAFVNQTGQQTPLISRPASLNIDYSPVMQEHNLSIIKEIPLRSEFNRFLFAGEALINPAGMSVPISIDDNSSLSVTIKVVIPFKLKIEDAYFTDTLKLQLASGGESVLGESDMIKEATLNLTLINGLPFNMNLQMLICDSVGHVLDSIFPSGQALYGNMDPAMTPRSENVVIQLTNEKAQKLLSAGNAILRFKINTDNRVITLNSNQYLQATIRGRFKLDVNKLIDFSFLETTLPNLSTIF